MSNDSELYPEGSYGRAIQDMTAAMDSAVQEIAAALVPVFQEMEVAFSNLAAATNLSAEEIDSLFEPLFDWYMQSIRRRYMFAWIAALVLLTLLIGMAT